MRIQLIRNVMLWVCVELGCINLVLGQRNNSYKNIEDINVGFSVGAHLGTQGMGLNVVYATSEVFALRVSGSLAPVGFNKSRRWGNQTYKVDMDARFYNAAFTMEVKPFRITSDCRFMQKMVVVGGLAYFFKAGADAFVSPSKDYYYGEIVIPKEELGHIRTRIKWKGWAPYLGTGIRDIYLGSCFKGGYLGLNLDIGSYYLASPNVKLSANNLLSGNSINERIIQNNLRNYRWLPVLQIGITYGFFNY